MQNETDRSIKNIKMYKNATRIRRECKNDYYNKTLEDNKNNTKGKLNILKVFFRNKQTKANYPDYFKKHGYYK